MQVFDSCYLSSVHMEVKIETVNPCIDAAIEFGVQNFKCLQLVYSLKLRIYGIVKLT